MSLVLPIGIAAAVVVAAIIAAKANQVRNRDLHVKAKPPYLASIEKTQVPNPPNIIVYLCDDLGYADVGCFGSTTIKTPNIDMLATRGCKFTSFYASNPICSPSRAGLLTGRYGQRAHVPFVFIPSSSPLTPFASLLYYSRGMKGLSTDEITIPDVLQRAGYATGMVGKWHLGDRWPHLPNDFGFDFFYGAHFSNDMKPYNIFRNREVEIKAPADQDHLIQHLTENALEFIENNKERPFFLYYAQPFPHNPLHASEAFRGGSNAGLYGDAVQEIDWSVGKLVDALEKHGLSDNTIIIFTSDNGPWHEGNPGYQRGRKCQSFEGGYRVPAIVSWPSRILLGTTCAEPVSNIDLFPTFLSILGITPPWDRIIDGKDISGLFADPSGPGPHDALFYFVAKRIEAIRKGKWKYHANHGSDNAAYWTLRPGAFLFDLETDPNESYNQAMNFPEVAEELAGELASMKASVKKNLRGWSKAQDRH
jgi:arylsulfatase A-like enzyme